MENPELYEVAKNLCHDYGYPWTDPRTGQTHYPPGQEYAVGEWVVKVGGDYTFYGCIIMAGKKKSGVWRYAVENTDGLVHIFSAKNLVKGVAP